MFARGSALLFVVLSVLLATSAALATTRHGRTRGTGHHTARAGRHGSHGGARHRTGARRRHHARRTHAPTPRTHRVTPVAVITAPTPRPVAGTTRSPGCGASHGAAGFSEETMVVRGVARTYLLAVPAGYTADTPLALVFAWHGRTGNPHSLRGYLGVEQAAAGGAIFVYPAGLREVPRGGGRSLTNWDIRANGDDVAFFDALLASLSAAYCVDPGRVFAVGHSAGAVVTNELGCHRGDVLRAIAPIAGSGPWGRRCTSPPAVWLAHGRADPDVAFRYGEASRDHWAVAAACGDTRAPDSVAPCERYAACGPEASRGGVVWCPHEGRHGVPSFAPRAIWAFFSALR